MAYVATVNLVSGGQFTGTSIASNESAFILTGTLTAVSPDGNTPNYILTSLGTGTAVIPKGNVRSLSVT